MALARGTFVGAFVVALLVAACGEDDVRGDQQQRFDPNKLQAFLTWGGRQSVANFTAASPGAILVFPAQPGLQAFPTGPGGIATLEQLVDARYAHPTTWTVSLYAVAQSAMPNGDSFGVTWSVRTSVGAATNDLTFQTLFLSTGGGGAPGAPPQSILKTFQLAAYAIQIIPTLVNYSFTSFGTNQALLAWSAWCAPVVE